MSVIFFLLWTLVAGFALIYAFKLTVQLSMLIMEVLYWVFGKKTGNGDFITRIDGEKYIYQPTKRELEEWNKVHATLSISLAIIIIVIVAVLLANT